MLLTMETVVAYDKGGYSSSYGWSGEYAKVWTGGETPDKKYYSSCWISFETRGTTFISVIKSEAWLYGYKDPDKVKYQMGYWSINGGTGGRKTHSRAPQSQTYAIKGICIGHFKNKILGTAWTREAKVTVEAADPPYISAIVFFNVTS